MRARRRRLDWLGPAAVLAGGLALVLPSCREPTQITVELRTDVACTTVTDATVTVGSLGSVKNKPAASSQKGCKSPDGRIGSLVVIPSGDNDDEVTIQAVMGVDGQLASGCLPESLSASCVVARRALRFVPHTPLFLPIELSASCLGKLCPDDQTCFEGNCVSAKLPDPESCTTPGGCGPKVDASADAPTVDGGIDSGSDALADAGPDGAATPNLIAHYDFEQTGTTALDSSGNQNDGQVVGGKLVPGAGHKSSGGLVLTTTTTATMQIGPSASLTGVTELTGATIAAWVNVTKAPVTLGFIFAHEPYTLDTLEAWIEPGLKVCIDTVQTPSGGQHYPACSSVPLTVGVWTHVAITADATTATLYFDGVGVAISKAPAPKFALSGHSFFGYAWDGVVDEARIYDRALSPAEIAALAAL